MRWPPLLGFLLLMILVPGFISLGQWQWQKGERKAEAQAMRDQRGADVAIDMPTQLLDPNSDAAAQLHFRPVTLHGQFIIERQFLLDNRVHKERAGFHVITPFRLAGSSTVVLVNRGWIAGPANHAELPVFSTPNQAITLSGTAVLPPSRFFSLSATGNTPDWTKNPLPVWQNLDRNAFASASQLPTQGLLVQLDPDAPAGFVRDWPRPDDRVERHYSYALQWYGFALSSVGIWLYFLLRELRK